VSADAEPFRARVSDDNGRTWRSVEDTDKDIGFYMMPNGKTFLCFEHKYAFEADFLKNYDPAALKDDWSVYFADDIVEYDDPLYALESDPLTGEVNRFPVKLIWKNKPYKVVSGCRLIPSAYMMQACQRYTRCIDIDGAMYMCTYNGALDCNADTRECAVTKYSKYDGCFILRSEDCGRTWECISCVLMDDDTFYDGKKLEGFTEPAMSVMPDGSVVMLMRSGCPYDPTDPDRYPCFITRSTDGCRTWSTPCRFDNLGVYPQILTLGCGVSLATYGRPGLYLKATGDPHGIEWCEHIQIDLTPGESDLSCYYTQLLPIDACTALLVYSEFYRPDDSGVPKKSIMARTVNVVVEDR
jgi:hypothetical protein